MYNITITLQSQYYKLYKLIVARNGLPCWEIA